MADSSGNSSPCVAAPRSTFDVFWVFTLIGIQSFGGALAIAQRELIDIRRWFDVNEFVSILTVCQSLPGPNVCILSVVTGDKFFGLKGALAGLIGITWLPLIVLSSAIVLYQGFSDLPQVQGALRGMAGVTAGMVLGSALKLTRSAKNSPLGICTWTLFAAGAFAATAIARIPLIWTLLIVGGSAIALAAAKLHRSANAESKNKE